MGITVTIVTRMEAADIHEGATNNGNSSAMFEQGHLKHWRSESEVSRGSSQSSGWNRWLDRWCLQSELNWESGYSFFSFVVLYTLINFVTWQCMHSHMLSPQADVRIHALMIVQVATVNTLLLLYVLRIDRKRVGDNIETTDMMQVRKSPLIFYG